MRHAFSSLLFSSLDLTFLKTALLNKSEQILPCHHQNCFVVTLKIYHHVITIYSFNSNADDGIGAADAPPRAINDVPVHVTTYFFHRWMWIHFPYVALGNCNQRLLYDILSYLMIYILSFHFYILYFYLSPTFSFMSYIFIYLLCFHLSPIFSFSI